MKQNNKTCVVCSKVYTYCPHCDEYKKYPKWMATFCSENCKNVFEIASGYRAKEISKEEAKLKFEECDLSNKSQFKDKILAIIKEVFGTTSSKAKRKAAVALNPEEETIQNVESHNIGSEEQTNSEN